jgi:FAD binding domain
MTIDATSTLRLYMPGSPGYREATAVHDLFAPVQPDEAVIADSVSSVAAAITRARSRGLGVEVISTGHGSSMADQMSGVLLVRTAPSGPVEVDPQTRRAPIPAGTRWGAVVEAAAQYGLGAVHASSSDVGAVGYLLRGGLSFYGRRFGLAVNSLRAVELVAADGQLHHVDADHGPSLFWAIRGGGGGFGVVTPVEIELFDAAGVWTGTLSAARQIRKSSGEPPSSTPNADNSARRCGGARASAASRSGHSSSCRPANGSRDSASTPVARRTRYPRSCPRRAAAPIRTDLPMPGSPQTARVRPASAAASTAAVRTSSSGSRPMI